MSLLNKRILVTRQKEQAAEFVAEIEKRGGRAVLFSMIDIVDPGSWTDCDQALARIGDYQALVFTSANGVERFFQRSEAKGVDPARLVGLTIYAVGAKTAREIERRGGVVHFVPDQYSSASLLEYFRGTRIRGMKFLHPTGNLGERTLDETLGRLGATVDVVEVYRNVPPDELDARFVLDLLKEKKLEVVMFASPSAARNFSEIVPADQWTRRYPHTKIAVIGPTTRDAVQDLGYPVDIIARESTGPGLLDAISDYYETSES